MTVQELHIDLDLKLQQVMSKTKGIIRPEEKDWFLTQSQLDFIDAKLTPSMTPKGGAFEDSQQYLDDLEELIEYDVLLKSTNKDNRTTIAYLPFDYLHLLEATAGIQYRCGDPVSDTLVSTIQTIGVMKFDDVYSDNFEDLTIEVGAAKFYDINNNFYKSKINNIKEKFTLIQNILWTINNKPGTTLRVYWEYFSSNFYSDSFIFVGNTTSDVEWTTSGGVQVVNMVNESRRYYTNPIALTSKVRIVKNNKLKDILKYSFTKTVHNSPVGNIAKKLLYIHNNSTFLVNDVSLTYLRVPQNVNILLNQSVELISAARKISDNAAQKIIALKARNNYEAFVKENVYKQ